MPRTVFDLRTAISAHLSAFEYAVCLVAESSRRAKEGQHLVALSALSVLAHEAVCLHRAIDALAEKGWAFAAPILTRSMLDLLLSALVIVNADRPDVAGFEYLYAFTGDELYKSNPAAQRETAASMNGHLAQMTTDEDRAAATAFVESQRRGPFWYSSRFGRPTDVIDAYGTGETRELWRRLSSASHGGYIGMRVNRPDPFHLDINPRKDEQAAAFALIGSTRVLIELLHVWGHFLRVPNPEYDSIKALLASAGAVDEMPQDSSK